VNTLGGSRNILLDESPNRPRPHSEGVGKILPIVDLLHITRMAGAKDLKLMCLWSDGGSNQTSAKVGYIGVEIGSSDLLLHLGLLSYL